ncbi:MAG: ABC transporter ATP-binding protein [Planctomycetota bacterium]
MSEPAAEEESVGGPVPGPAKGPPAVACVAVEKEYEGGMVRALRGVSFEVAQGTNVAIIGPSGSGKSTLLHLIGALDRPTRGTVSILGQDLAQVRDLDGLRARTLGFVFQLHNLIPNLSLWENVGLPAIPLGVPRRERRARATRLLERVGLGHRIDFDPVKCSGGERQRAAVARALVNDPRILLADEPTGSVDTDTGRHILELFADFAKETGMTRIVITHNPQIAAEADQVLRVVDGHLAEPAKGA